MAPLTQAEKRLARQARKKKRTKRAQAHNPYGFQVADTIECTYHIHKFIHGRIVKLDPEVSKKVWKKGRKSVQERIRLRFSRRVETREGPHKGKKYTYVTHVPIESFSGLQDVVIEDAKDPVEAENAVSEDVSEMVEKDSEMEAHDDTETDAQEDSKMENQKEDPKPDVQQESSKAQENADDGVKNDSRDNPSEVSGDKEDIAGNKTGE
ncbi:60S ribosomal protein L31 [Podila verticillata]|nr:60S ribosomal protein L31 [Podila verticillata]